MGEPAAAAGWHECSDRFGCPSHTAHLRVSGQHCVDSIIRPLLLFAVSIDSAQQQEHEALVRRVHRSVVNEEVVCNSFTHAAGRRLVGERTAAQRDASWTQRTKFNSWPNTADPDSAGSADKLTARWTRETLDARGAVYLTDIVRHSAELGPDTAELMARKLIGEQTASGFLLRHCRHKGAGVHSPSFFALFACHEEGEEACFTSPHHNESHRIAAWHLLLRHSQTV